jgi:UDP-glucose 4-epimerase
MFNKYRNTKVNIVRAVNAYGPRQLAVAPFGPGKVRKITPSFVCRALTHMDVEVYGDGSQVSDMVYVADVAKALVNAMAKAHMGEVFDVPVEVGPEVNSTVQEVAELIIAISGSQSKIVNLPMRPGEIPGAVVKADTSTLKLVDMDPKDLVGLPVGMQLTVDYFKEYLNETGARKLDS